MEIRCIKCGKVAAVDEYGRCGECGWIAEAEAEAREGLKLLSIYLLHHAEFAEWLETHGR